MLRGINISVFLGVSGIHRQYQFFFFEWFSVPFEKIKL